MFSLNTITSLFDINFCSSEFANSEGVNITICNAKKQRYAAAVILRQAQ